MNDKRLSATRFIWSILAILLLSVIAALMLSGSALDLAGSVLIGLLIIAAAISTIAIWKAPADFQAARSGKAKRGDRLADLLARLDDDEIYELQTRLGHSRELDDARSRVEDWYDDESSMSAR